MPKWLYISACLNTAPTLRYLFPTSSDYACACPHNLRRADTKASIQRSGPPKWAGLETQDEENGAKSGPKCEAKRASEKSGERSCQSGGGADREESKRDGGGDISLVLRPDRPSSLASDNPKLASLRLPFVFYALPVQAY